MGISESRDFKNDSYSEKSVYAICSTANFENGKRTIGKNPFNNMFTSEKSITVDMKLDLEKGKLNFYNFFNEQEFEMKNIVVAGNGFVPHFNLTRKNSCVSFKRISPLFYSVQN